MTYQSFLDFAGDQRGPDFILTPPGGSTGDRVADSMLCVIAEGAKGAADPVAYLRERAAYYAGQFTVTPAMATVIDRISQWCDERRAA